MIDRDRCPWPGTDALYLHYHDHEWGVPLHDEHRLFEMLVLEGAQAGLSWITVLRKRERYREVFDGFDPVRVARFTPARIERLLRDEGIIRNRLKVASAVSNARAFLRVQDEEGSFDRFIWSCAGGRPQVNRFTAMREVPARTDVSDRMSRELKRRGFSFVGSTICYAYMQATGMVNDHLVGCARHAACARLR